MRSLKVFRDPLYNYIPFSRIDGQVIDSALFQRLRYVSQNALAHLTYHSNRTSRFSHSLGCMHVGGRLFLAGLRNADEDISRRFIDACGGIVKEITQQHEVRLDRIKAFLLKDRDPFYIHNGIRLSLDAPTETLVAEVAMLEAVRLACVIHDIGHPPFSHTVEGVIESQLEGRTEKRARRGSPHDAFMRALSPTRPTLDTQIHEAAGQLVMDYVFSSSVTSGKTVFFDQLCLRLAKAVARGVPVGFEDPHGVIWALHELVSGELDADRADYVARDGYASAFEFGTYDLERVITGTRMVFDGGRYKFRASTTALSAIESFFVERLRIYRWLVFHHNVIRAHVSLQRALQLMFDLVFGSPRLDNEDDRGLRQFLVEPLSRFWAPFSGDDDALDAYKRVDENWLMTLFRDVLDYKALASDHLPEPLALLRVYLEFVCDRRKLLLPLWKRLAEYQVFCAAFLEAARSPEYESFFESGPNDVISPGRFASAVEFTNAVFRAQLAVREGNLPVWGGELALFERFEQAVERNWPTGACPGKIVFTYAHKMRPAPRVRDPGAGALERDFALVSPSDDRLVELSGLSSQVAELDSVWAKDVQAWAFLIPGQRVSDGFEVETKEGVEIGVTREMAQASAKVLLDPMWRSRVLVEPRDSGE